MVQRYPGNPNISFRVDKDFQEVIDNKAEELGIQRSELLRNLVYNVLNYPVSDKQLKTVTVGKLKQMLEPLPDELPVIAYSEDNGMDYGLSELSLFSLLAGLKLEPLPKPINKEKWELDDLVRWVYGTC